MEERAPSVRDVELLQDPLTKHVLATLAVYGPMLDRAQPENHHLELLLKRGLRKLLQDINARLAVVEQQVQPPVSTKAQRSVEARILEGFYYVLRKRICLLKRQWEEKFKVRV